MSPFLEEFEKFFPYLCMAHVYNLPDKNSTYNGKSLTFHPPKDYHCRKFFLNLKSGYGCLAPDDRFYISLSGRSILADTMGEKSGPNLASGLPGRI